MTISLDALATEIQPARTALLFGAGSSLPSGALTGAQMALAIAKRFRVGLRPDGETTDMGLADVASLVEIKHSRRELVDYIRELTYPLRPAGGIIEIPRYPWREIFTTNYDNLIERSMANMAVEYTVISANYDFEREREGVINIFKLHGTIDRDKIDGDLSTLIISNQDYADTMSYREDLYDRLLIAGSTNTLLIVGHSLADPDLNEVIDEAIRRRRSSGSVGKAYVLSFQRDDDRALLLEQRGLRVAFGGLDELATALSSAVPAASTIAVTTTSLTGNVLGLPGLMTEVSHARRLTSDAARMFNGSAASYADIEAGITFERDAALAIQSLLQTDGAPLVIVTGVAGVGKTTAVRQALVRLSAGGAHCFEHAQDRPLIAQKWIEIDRLLREREESGVLFVDDAHKYVHEIGQLIDFLGHDDDARLSVVLATSRAHWNVRTKSESIYLVGHELSMSQLSQQEIDRLLDLFQTEPRIASLVEREFAGFSRVEKRRRLIQKCRSDFFVCLRNITSSELLDDIILREYAALTEEKQQIYKLLSGLESAGVRVHRQTMIRMLGIAADRVAALLDDMNGMVAEGALDDRNGIYTWHGRHVVISGIISRARYRDDRDLFNLFDAFIDQANTSYFIERTNLQEICQSEGIRQIANRQSQNILFRKIISKAPTLRPPRHRLISNLITQGSYERASDEIKIFETDLGRDGPLVRYQVLLRLRRAENVQGLASEDRRNLVEQAATLARESLEAYPHDKLLLDVYCAAGLQYVRQFGDWTLLDEAMEELKRRSENSVDNEVRRIYSNWVIKVQDVKSGRN